MEAAAGEWETVRQQVEAFVQRHSRLPRQLPRPQLGLVEGEQELGQWVTLQRRRRDRSSGTALSAAQKAALEATPRWEWGPLRQQVLLGCAGDGVRFWLSSWGLLRRA